MGALARPARRPAIQTAYAVGRATVCAWLLLCSACAAWGERHYRALTRDVQTRHFERGLARVQSAEHGVYGARNRWLYWADKAVLEQALGQSGNAHLSFEALKTLTQTLYTQHITAHAQALFFGERRLPYRGEPLEQVAVHLLEADGYLNARNNAEALVELRQMQQTLLRCNAQNEQNASVYRDDAAGRWIAGLLREADRELGSLSDARIDLAEAVALYDRVEARAFGTPCPTFARAALQRVQQRLAESDGSGSKKARVVLLFYDGLAPHKREAFWETVVPPMQIVRVAYPVFWPTPAPRYSAQLVDVQGGQRVSAELASDFAAKAMAHLAERMESIRKTAMGRAVAKAVATGALQVAGLANAGNAGGLLELVGLGLNIANTATEHADVRSWRTLPARLSIAELDVEPGEIDVEVQWGSGAQPQAARRLHAHAAAGEAVFLSQRAF